MSEPVAFEVFIDSKKLEQVIYRAMPHEACLWNGIVEYINDSNFK
jgi:hypothetical protein